VDRRTLEMAFGGEALKDLAALDEPSAAAESVGEHGHGRRSVWKNVYSVFVIVQKQIR
jgi:hypothetical protein